MALGLVSRGSVLSGLSNARDRYMNLKAAALAAAFCICDGASCAARARAHVGRVACSLSPLKAPAHLAAENISKMETALSSSMDAPMWGRACIWISPQAGMSASGLRLQRAEFIHIFQIGRKRIDLRISFLYEHGVKAFA